MIAVFLVAGTLLAQVPSAADLNVHHVTLITSTPMDFAERQQIIHSIKARKLTRNLLDDDLNQSFSEIARDAFQIRGFFKAQVGSSEVRIVGSTPQRQVVDLIVKVTPGNKYRLDNISFSNGAVLPVDLLRHQFAIGDGELLDISRLRDGLENLRRLYLEHGYIDLVAVPDTEIDEITHTVSILISIDEEGHVYHIGKLIVDGDEWRAGSKAKLLRDWKSYQGQPYSPEVLRAFLRDEHASPDVDPDSLFKWEVINATHVWPNLDVSPYTINFRITLANPSSCRTAPGEKLVQFCALVQPDRMPAPH